MSNERQRWRWQCRCIHTMKASKLFTVQCSLEMRRAMREWVFIIYQCEFHFFSPLLANGESSGRHWKLPINYYYGKIIPAVVPTYDISSIIWRWWRRKHPISVIHFQFRLCGCDAAQGTLITIRNTNNICIDMLCVDKFILRKVEHNNKKKLNRSQAATIAP